MSNSDPKSRPRPGPWPPAPDNSALPPSSWAKRTGFRPKFSGETNASDSGQISLPPRPSPASREPDPAAQPDLEAGRPRPPPPTVNGQPEKEKEKEKAQTKAEKEKAVKKRSGAGANGNAPNPAVAAEPFAAAQQRRTVRSEEAVDALPPQSGADDDGVMGRHSHMKYEIRDTPGLGKFLSFLSLSLSIYTLIYLFQVYFEILDGYLVECIILVRFTETFSIVVMYLIFFKLIKSFSF